MDLKAAIYLLALMALGVGSVIFAERGGWIGMLLSTVATLLIVLGSSFFWWALFPLDDPKAKYGVTFELFWNILPLLAACVGAILTAVFLPARQRNPRHRDKTKSSGN